MFTRASLKIIEFCSEEIFRQQDDPRYVFNMVEAYDYALRNKDHNMMMTDIMEMGRLAKPDINTQGFRRMNVYRQGKMEPIGIDWKNIERAMINLVGSRDEMTPAEFYKEFEEIHPFEDGNGRTGKIIFNWLNGTLNSPVNPPRFWA